MFASATKLNIPNIHILRTDRKELYPDNTSETTWVLTPIIKRAVEHQLMLSKEPPVRLRTPDPRVSQKAQ